jgi:hypothetical protein
MATITIDVSPEFVDLLAEAIAVKSLKQAGMLPPDFSGPVSEPATPQGVPVPPPPPVPAPVPADPWAGAGGTSAPAPPGPGVASPPVYAAPSVITVQTRQGAQTWTLAPPGAPMCQHNEPAAFVRGTTKDGKPYSAYRCALGSGPNWRSKCEFNQWA